MCIEEAAASKEEEDLTAFEIINKNEPKCRGRISM